MVGSETRSGELSSADGSTLVTGNAAVFGAWTTIGGAFRERLAPGCFTKSLRDHPDVLALWNHDWSLVLGRTTSGSLRLFDEPTGLRFELDLDHRTPDGQRALGTVDRGDVAGCSFAMQPRVEEWEDPGNVLPHRTILEASIFEITLTPVPAYPQSSVTLARSNSINAARRRAEAAMRRRRIL